MYCNLFGNYYLSVDHFRDNFYSNKITINDISKCDMIVGTGSSDALLNYYTKTGC